jgi:adenylate cyclase
VYDQPVTASASAPVPILICDDDPDIRMAMKRTLRGYDITEAGTPREAIDALKAKKYAALVSDFSRESDQDGLELLQHARMMYPEMIRFLVTANREVDVAVRAVNEGAVDRYFLKPWDEHKLRDALEILIRARSQVSVTKPG